MVLFEDVQTLSGLHHPQTIGVRDDHGHLVWPLLNCSPIIALLFEALCG